jgi:hypothetical protein
MAVTESRVIQSLFRDLPSDGRHLAIVVRLAAIKGQVERAGKLAGEDARLDEFAIKEGDGPAVLRRTQLLGG